MKRLLRISLRYIQSINEEIKAIHVSDLGKAYRCSSTCRNILKTDILVVKSTRTSMSETISIFVYCYPQDADKAKHILKAEFIKRIEERLHRFNKLKTAFDEWSNL